MNDRVYIRHIRATNLCMSGARIWFQQQGLDWSNFISNGIPIDQIKALDCPLADRVVAAAEKEYNNGIR